jgi:hypothetical protein
VWLLPPEALDGTRPTYEPSQDHPPALKWDQLHGAEQPGRR